MANKAVEIVGGRQFRKELRKLADGPTVPAAIGGANKLVAAKAQADVRADAPKAGRQAVHFAQAIVGKGTVAAARLQLQRTGKKQEFAGAQGAFWGSKQYAQFPAWVGNSYDVAVPGQGPQPMNDTLAFRAPEYAGIYEAAVIDACRPAFPN